jgi:hypothetical protein
MRNFPNAPPIAAHTLVGSRRTTAPAAGTLYWEG